MMDRRQHKQPIVRYELVEGETDRYGQLVWRLTLTCGHTITRASGRPPDYAGQYGVRTINSVQCVGVMRRVSCDECLRPCTRKGGFSP